MRKNGPQRNRRKEGVPLRHTEIFCSEFVARMIAQTGYNAESQIKQFFLDKGISQEKLQDTILLKPLIPEDIKFKSIHPNYLSQLISSFATKLPYPDAIQKVFKSSEFN